MALPSKRWHETDTIKFVELYEKAECLWNYQHAGYKHRAARERAIREIIKKMDMPDFGANELKAKIKNIRSTYMQEVNKIRRSKLGLGNDILEEYKTNLVWFPIADRFLRNVINSGKYNPNMKLEDDMSLYQINNAFFVKPEESLSHEIDLDDNNATASESRAADFNVKEETMDQDNYVSSNQPKKIRLEVGQPYQSPIELTRCTSDGPDASRHSNGIVDDVQKDEWYYFGANISCQLRNMPVECALRCQTKIMDILTETRVGAIKRRRESKNEKQ